MKNFLVKEFRLFASPLTWFFLAFSLMALIPGYPILMGAFFVCFGIFQSFQLGRETNDILYTVLLPIRKGDAVRAKFLFAAAVELAGFSVMAGLTVLRMTALRNAPVYVGNALMNATPVFLAFVLLIVAAFHFFFLRGFFRTAYRIGKPFVAFAVASFLLIAAAESLHYFPGLSFLNATGGERPEIQLPVLLAAAALYAAVTALSMRLSLRSFERVDL